MRRIAALPALLLLAGCGGSDELNTPDTEKKIAAAIEREVREAPASVDCPDGVKVRKGASFDCTLTASGGEQGTVHVTLTDADGHYTFKVSPR